MKTPEEYVDSLRRMNHEVYMFGERITDHVDHPIIKPSTSAVAATYELAQRELAEAPDAQIYTATSHLSKKRISRFTNIHQSIEDLVKKGKMGRGLGKYTGCCFQRCVGTDAMNAMSIVSHDIDQKHGTEYSKRFLKWLRYIQNEDLVVDGAMTDPKGDRGLRPSEQTDPDQYVHVAEESNEGIVVRGAKLHQTGAVNSHEIIVLPTRNMMEDDREYAIAFALPSDAVGILYIYGRQSCDTRKMEGGEIDVGNPLYGGQEAMVVFDDVLVPWDRVFMYKEYEFAGDLVEKFAAYHRHSYACKAGVGDVLIGACQLLAEYQGTARAPHIRDKIVEMIHLNETVACCSLACAYEGHREPSGTYLVNMLWSNVTKLNVTRFPYEIARMAQDIAGGSLVTMPSEIDMKDPNIGRWVRKYLAGVCGVPPERRSKVMRLIENLTMGTGAVGYLTESMHGAGSPQAMRIMISRLANFDGMKDSVKRILELNE